MMAAWVEAVQQNPVAVNCPAAAAPDPFWDRAVLALLPAIPAFLVAWLAFRWQSRKEQQQWERNQGAARDQWLRDQKRAEWRELLEIVNSCETNVGNCKRAIAGEKASHLSSRFQKLSVERRKVRQRLGDRLFIHDRLATLRDEWTHGERDL